MRSHHALSVSHFIVSQALKSQKQSPKCIGDGMKAD